MEHASVFPAGLAQSGKAQNSETLSWEVLSEKCSQVSPAPGVGWRCVPLFHKEHPPITSLG